MEWFRNVERFIFGSECLGCGRVSEKLDPWLCPDCVEELERESKGMLSPTPDACSLFPLRPLTRKLVHALKYNNIPGLATYLVRRSVSLREGAIGSEFGLFPHPLYLVPVPLHRARLRERGYNQAEKIAAALAVVTGGKVCNWLRRKSFVVSQTKLTKEERGLNVADVFEYVGPRPMPPRGTVVVVDDVYTTGATTAACVRAFPDISTLTFKVCTLLYDEPASVVVDFAADCRMEWEYH